MRICHVSPHLPPDQAANALLPAQLGWWFRARGDEITYIAHEPAQASAPAAAQHDEAAPALAGPVRWIPRRAPQGALAHTLRLDLLRMRRRIVRALDELATGATLLHLHSNGFIIEAAAAWARRVGVPYVLTLYGTEVWHYKPRRLVDPFTSAYRGAAQVTFYSRRLLERAQHIGLDRPGMSVVYPAVDDHFVPADERERAAERHALGIRESQVVLNVKRLHELAGQRFLIDAFAHVARNRPDIRLVICGDGPLRSTLEHQVREAGIADRVTFTGLVPNREVARFMVVADVFVLPSVLEALPTVAVEALASGTPVISADHPGGVELHAIFGDDVCVVPRQSVEPLTRVIEEFLQRPRRTLPATAMRLARSFRPPAITEEFAEVYRAAVT